MHYQDLAELCARDAMVKPTAPGKRFENFARLPKTKFELCLVVLGG
jgi:hypothetical protein